MLTYERLKNVLRYDPENGEFRWIKTGVIAGCIHKTHGYWVIQVDGRSYRAHRLAWLYVTGEWPKDQIDHRDTVKTNNSWENLREANNSQNHGNTKRHSNNTSGHKGVYWETSRKRWRAQIEHKRKLVFMRRFKTKEEAAAAYAEAARQHFGEFARAG